ncbi:C40 family peptidase [Undibacterium sp. SXout11W]|uniref:C40 family peptidase n=1 Tax=Undibacterium sp. SXout11W TaxID=3413050 RepID=UPI003BF22CBC
MTPEKQAEIVAEAKTWLQTPYHHHGDVKGAGVDCAMILVEVYHACGLIPKIDPRPYPPDWHLHRDAERYLGWVEQYADPVETPEPGDIAVFQFGRCVSHAAIVIDWPLVLHAFRKEREVVLSDVSTSSDFSERLRGFYRLKG